MTTRQNSSIAIVFILGLLAMLMPLSIDMYLPALPVISEQFGVPAGSAQMTLSTYILGFAVGQLFYGPMADSLGRKPVILGGTLVFAAAAVACALAQTIDQLIVMRFFHGLPERRVLPHDVIRHAGHDNCAINGTDYRWLGAGMAELALYLLDPRHGGYSGVGDDPYTDQRDSAGRASPAVSPAYYYWQLCLAVSS